MTNLIVQMHAIESCVLIDSSRSFFILGNQFPPPKIPKFANTQKIFLTYDVIRGLPIQIRLSKIPM